VGATISERWVARSGNDQNRPTGLLARIADRAAQRQERQQPPIIAGTPPWRRRQLENARRGHRVADRELDG
jgi:hypothetical protein